MGCLLRASLGACPFLRPLSFFKLSSLLSFHPALLKLGKSDFGLQLIQIIRWDFGLEIKIEQSWGLSKKVVSTGLLYDFALNLLFIAVE